MATILCVDDDKALCQILEKALRGAGHRVVAAHDGDQAVDLARAEAPELALLDIGLPRRDGFAVAEAVRTMPAPVGQIPILIMSGFRATPKAEKRAEAIGVAAILQKPVPLSHLLAVIQAQLKGQAPAARPSERRARPSGTAARRVARPPTDGAERPQLSGTLQELSFPHLLHELHGLRATGVLMLAAGRKKKAIQFREGYPVAVKSNLVNECLGNMLVADGTLTRAQLGESIQRMKRGEGLQGQILVAMQILSEEAISQVLQRQAGEKLLEIFRWTGGSFQFQTGARLKDGNALAVGCSPANWILVGVRDWVPLARIDAWLRENRGRTVVAAVSPFYRFQEIELEAPERELLESANGRPLDEVARADEEVRRALYGLLVTGLLEVKQSAAKAPAAAAPADRNGAASRAAPGTAKAPAEPPARPLPRARPGQSAPAAAGAGTAPAARAPNPEAERALRAELAAMAERLRGQTYFEMLDLDREADEDAVHAAYEKVASRMHPDRFQQSSDSVRQLAQEVFDLLTQAHDTLADARRRGAYLIQLKKGERSEAERKAAEVALDAEIAFQKGEAKLRGRDYEGALESFGEALQRQPEEGEYHAHYGWALYLCHPDESAMVSEAIEHVRRGVKLARDREKPYLFLGRLYKAVGRTAAAEKMFTRAVQIRPDSVESLRELRVINMRRDKGKGLLGRFLKR